MTFYTYFQSPIGKMLLFSDGLVLTGLYFDNQKYVPSLDLQWGHDPDLEIFSVVQHQLLEYFAGTRKSFDFGYRFEGGTIFQQKVWNALAQLPYGGALSYKHLAESVGVPKGIRAVAAAVGRNPISLVIPCHRIIGSDGSLVGYAGGLGRKKELLALEQNKFIG